MRPKREFPDADIAAAVEAFTVEDVRQQIADEKDTEAGQLNACCDAARAKLAGTLRTLLADAYLAGAMHGFGVTLEGFNSEYMGDHMYNRGGAGEHLLSEHEEAWAKAKDAAQQYARGEA